MILFERRRFLKTAAGIALATGLPFQRVAAAELSRLKPKTPPVWAGFGLNGDPGQARYALTREYLQKYKNIDISKPEAFLFVNDALRSELKKSASDLVTFKSEVKLGEDYLIGLAHDYEVATAYRREDLKEQAKDGFIVTFLAGVGMILTYEKSSGWRVLSSFPFVTFETRGIPDFSKARESMVSLMNETYASHAQKFATMLGRFSKWNAGYRSNYFARVVSAKVGEVATPQFKEYKIDELMNGEYLGFQASSAICDGLDIPMLPFKVNDALANRYATKFSESLITQDAVAIPDADLEFELLVIKATKERVPSRQLGIVTVTRRLILGVRIFDKTSGKRERLLQAIAGAPEDADVLKYGSPDDDNPERDFVFFDRLLYRTLSQLMKGIATNDKALLTSLGINYDDISGGIPKVLQQCANAR
jgi:hypothetical protein